jgi:hypothetical protein
MDTRIDEIAAGLFRISTFVPQIAPPAGFTFNQFLVMAEEPLLFHLGHRKLFPATAAAVSRVLPVEKLRWLSFGHVEADECGAMNEWLSAAPDAEIVHGLIGTRVSVNDMADRPARALADGEIFDIGGRVLHFIDTPHVPHGWEAGVFFEEMTQTLLCGDLFTHPGDGPPGDGCDAAKAGGVGAGDDGLDARLILQGRRWRRLAASGGSLRHHDPRRDRVAPDRFFPASQKCPAEPE